MTGCGKDRAGISVPDGRYLIVVKYISHGSKAFEINGLFRIFFEIFSKSHHEGVNRPGRGFSGIPPADFQKFVPGKRLSFIGDEEL